MHALFADAAWMVVCILITDLITGIMHWAEDTWTAPSRNRFIDAWIVQPNIDHHRHPGKMREGGYWETNRVCIALAVAAMAILAAAHVHAWQPYLVFLLASHSNHVHLWSHSSRTPGVVRRLQKYGILQSPSHHAKHHKTPYATRFCTLTNALNPVLDALGFWRALEWGIERCGLCVKRATPARDGY